MYENFHKQFSNAIESIHSGSKGILESFSEFCLISRLSFQQVLRFDREREEKIIQMQVIQESSSTERKRQAETVSEGLDISEDETRFFIDDQLRRVGWTVDTKELRYSKGARPQKGVNQAIAEWPTDSKVSKTGYADYALFIGLQLIGIIEAKKALSDIPSVIDYQCKDYSRCIKENDSKYCLTKCCKDFKVPFISLFKT